MSMRTPLGKVRGLGSAREGTEHFWRQRLTALANIPLVIIFVIFIAANTGLDYTSARAVLGAPLTALFLLLLTLSGVYHMCLGMQAIIEDYVSHELLKTLALMVNIFFSAAIALAAILAIFKLALGG